mmetsp:Transcript_74890/g.161968  ORF Transcript_74890/g.161968 Transcript_74890/m.161968 type:complete len:110 (-) Transcript_74890:945-1274(-)
MLLHKYVQRHIIKNLTESHIGTALRIGGWQKTSRKSSNVLLFMELNDGSCQSNLQVVIDGNVPGFEEAAKSLAGSSFMVEGMLKESPAKGQKFELHASNVKMLGGSDEK